MSLLSQIAQLCSGLVVTGLLTVLMCELEVVYSTELNYLGGLQQTGALKITYTLIMKSGMDLVSFFKISPLTNLYLSI